jgi:hypothetical protein
MPLRRALRTAAVLAWLAGAAPVAAAELEQRTIQAYDAYLESARRAFLLRASGEQRADTRQAGVQATRPGREDGIIEVPGGLVHHWVAAAFVRRTTLQQVLGVSMDYPAYNDVYKSIIRSRLLDRKGDTYHVLMRLTEGEAGVRAVLDIRSTVGYFFPGPRRAYVISNADEIREVKNSGSADERLLPPGRDSGYLWRASTFTRFVEQDGGVYIESETLGLSRRFPPFLGWIIEPIARRLGRKSVEGSLQEFIVAIEAAT